MLHRLATCLISGRLFRATAVALAAGLAASCSQPELSRSAPPGSPQQTRPSAAVDTSLTQIARHDEEPSQELGPERTLSDRDIDWQANPVMQTLGNIARTVTHTEYSHSQRVNVQQGIYVFDCSLMAQWVLKRATPVAEKSVSRGLSWRPLAADFQRRIASVPPGAERGGWRRVARVQDAAPGDVLAWLKPKIIDSKNTGHVSFIALPPTRVAGYRDAYLVRVVDATSLLHADDTRVDGSGFGLGTILLVVDPETDAPRAYGWVGLAWRAFETPIAIGRPSR